MDDANEWRLGFSSDADIVRLTNARIIIIIFLRERGFEHCRTDVTDEC